MSIRTISKGVAVAEVGASAPEDEYKALTEGAALLDRSSAGRLRLAGEDALDLLNRLSTNDLTTLDVGQGLPTVLTSNKGRIIDLLFVLRQADDLLVLTAAETRQKVAEWIDFYTFVEDVTVTDITDETAMFSVAGPGSAKVLDSAAGADISSTGRYQSADAELVGVASLVIRTDHLRLPEYYLMVPASDGPALREGLLRANQGDVLTPVGIETVNAVRIENGAPEYGAELSEAYNPLEADLLDLISFDKGCYVGQEVVTRLNTYKKVQKYLVRLRLASESGIESGEKLLLDGKQVGLVTSSATLPGREGAVGLGYVRKAHVQPGSLLDTEQDSGAVEVVGLGSEI